MDLIDLAMAGIAAISLGITIIVMAWPTEAEASDPFAHPFGEVMPLLSGSPRDHSFPDSARPASRADQGSGGNGNASQGAAAARTLSGSDRHAR